jgi:hypothetical protein
MLFAIFEILWVALVYFSLYYGIEYLLENKRDVFKILFNLDLRYYTQETHKKNKHETLHFIASMLVILILCIKPLINCLVYWLVFSFIDVSEVNSILLIITWLQFLKCWDGQRFVVNWFIFGQVLYTMLNYDNVESLFPAMFQISDYCFEAEFLFQKIHYVYLNIINKDPPEMLLELTAKVKMYQMKLRYVRLSVLCFLAFYSILFTDLYMTSEVLFYYYAAFRITQVFFTCK